ncbi:RBM14 protein, partial [Penelope pileata]|nr:RBM14 protein [Penelope pileata]
LSDYAFVHMENEADAKVAIENLNGKEVKGRRVNVELSTNVQKKGAGPAVQAGVVVDKNKRIGLEYRENGYAAASSLYDSQQRFGPAAAKYDGFEAQPRPSSPAYFGRDRSPLRRSPPRAAYATPVAALPAAAQPPAYRAQPSASLGAAAGPTASYGAQSVATHVASYGAQPASYGAQPVDGHAASYAAQPGAALSASYGAQPMAAHAGSYGAQPVAAHTAAAYGAQPVAGHSAYGAQHVAALSASYGAQAAASYGAQPAASLPASYGSQPAAAALSATYGAAAGSSLPASYGSQPAVASYKAQAAAPLTAAYRAQASGSLAASYPVQQASSASLAAAYRAQPGSAYDGPSQLGQQAASAGARRHALTVPRAGPSGFAVHRAPPRPQRQAPGTHPPRSPVSLLSPRYGSDRRLSELSDFRRLADSPLAFRRSPTKSPLDYRRLPEAHAEYGRYSGAYGDYLPAARVPSGYQRRL